MGSIFEKHRDYLYGLETFSLYNSIIPTIIIFKWKCSHYKVLFH